MGNEYFKSICNFEDKINGNYWGQYATSDSQTATLSYISQEGGNIYIYRPWK